jgi:hypothetical protein
MVWVDYKAVNKYRTAPTWLTLWYDLMDAAFEAPRFFLDKEPTYSGRAFLLRVWMSVALPECELAARILQRLPMFMLPTLVVYTLEVMPRPVPGCLPHIGTFGVIGGNFSVTDRLQLLEEGSEGGVPADVVLTATHPLESLEAACVVQVLLTLEGRCDCEWLTATLQSALEPALLVHASPFPVHIRRHMDHLPHMDLVPYVQMLRRENFHMRSDTATALGLVVALSSASAQTLKQRVADLRCQPVERVWTKYSDTRATVAVDPGCGQMSPSSALASERCENLLLA